MHAAVQQKEVLEWVVVADRWSTWHKLGSVSRPSSVHTEVHGLEHCLWKLLRTWQELGLLRSIHHVPGATHLLMRLLEAERVLFTDAAMPLFRCMVHILPPFISSRGQAEQDQDPKTQQLNLRSGEWSRERLQATTRGIRKEELHPLSPDRMPQNSASLSFLLSQGFSMSNIQAAIEDEASEALQELMRDTAAGVAQTDELAECGAMLVNASSYLPQGRLLTTGELLLQHWSSCCSASDVLPPISSSAQLSSRTTAALFAHDTDFLAEKTSETLHAIATRPFMHSEELLRFLRPFALAAFRAPWVLLSLTSALEDALIASEARDDRITHALSGLRWLIQTEASKAEQLEPPLRWSDVDPLASSPLAPLLDALPASLPSIALLLPSLADVGMAGDASEREHDARLSLSLWVASCHSHPLLGHCFHVLARAECTEDEHAAAASVAAWAVNPQLSTGSEPVRALLALSKTLRAASSNAAPAESHGSGREIAVECGATEMRVLELWERGGEVLGRFIVALAVTASIPLSLRCLLLRLLQTALPSSSSLCSRHNCPLPLPVCFAALRERLRSTSLRLTDPQEAAALHSVGQLLVAAVRHDTLISRDCRADVDNFERLLSELRA